MSDANRYSAGKIHRISISDVKGTKKRNIDHAVIVEDHGISGDAHAGSDRQVSLLPLESFPKIDKSIINIKPGDFAENLTTEGLDFSGVEVGNQIRIGKDVVMIVTQIGKECHLGCNIREIVGDCIMPREGVFAKVIQGGEVKLGDPINWE
jgi:MOSC domain-containing protein YiiM